MNILETSDGSHSLLSDRFEVTYHSRHGAVQETQHVFVEAGLQYHMDRPTISVLEVGFGTGLNAFMTLLEAQRTDREVHYETIEAFPISPNLAESLNFPEILGVPEKRGDFLRLHTEEWGHRIEFDRFHFKKHQVRLEEFSSNDRFDVIYFDAFAPNAQPELWEATIFQNMYRLLRPGGVLTTYCAKGVVKRTLRAVGFEVEALPGPPGKREMTRAMRPALKTI